MGVSNRSWIHSIINPRSTLDQPKINSRSTQNQPKINPSSTLVQPRIISLPRLILVWQLVYIFTNVHRWIQPLFKFVATIFNPVAATGFRTKPATQTAARTTTDHTCAWTHVSLQIFKTRKQYRYEQANRGAYVTKHSGDEVLIVLCKTISTEKIG